jgi:hypothetical protein
MAGLRKRFAHVATLGRANMRMGLQGECEAFLKLAAKRLTHAAVIARLEAGEKPGDRLCGNLEHIQSWCSRTCGRRERLRVHETTSRQQRARTMEREERSTFQTK